MRNEQESFKIAYRTFLNLAMLFPTPIMRTVIGWLMATFVKELIAEKGGYFPLLAIEGERGSGKTTLSSLLGRLLSSARVDTDFFNNLSAASMKKLLAKGDLILDGQLSPRAKLQLSDFVSSGACEFTLICVFDEMRLPILLADKAVCVELKQDEQHETALQKLLKENLLETKSFIQNRLAEIREPAAKIVGLSGLSLAHSREDYNAKVIEIGGALLLALDPARASAAVTRTNSQ